MRKLSNIQVLRGLAALAVVTFHARGEVDGVGMPTRLPSFLAGAFGVDVFFVVSGLVMVYASAPLFGAARAVLPFIGKRIARVVPLYWAVTALFVLLAPAAARGGLGHGAFNRYLALSLAFVPYAGPVNDDATPVYSTGWTLSYEMAFYACFAATLALPRRAAVAVLVCGFAALVASAKAVALPGWLAYLGASNVLEFAAGLLIAELALSGLRLPRPAALALAAAGCAAALAAAPVSDAWWGEWRGVVWGLPAAAIVAAAALCPAAEGGGPVRRWLERLGDASYALYLVHEGLNVAAAAAVGRWGGPSRVPAGAYLLGLVGLALAVGFTVHRRFEVPVTRWLQRRIAPHRPPSLAVSGP
ncbi:acyltransferase family protein [Lichenibacterium minor]|nr:acyltransferase [Lichenibacterium minor]